MALTMEWRRRLDRWRKELPRHFYRPLGKLELEGFVTKEQLSPEQAARGDFRPMPAGTRWGAKWEYGWFRGEAVLPEEAAGRRVVLELGLGGEILVYVNGRAASGRSRVDLSKQGVAGERYGILAECYAGHGPRVCSAGPVPPGRETVPEPGPTQAEVGESSFGVWEEEIYQLGIDVETLAKLREAISDDDSLRVQQIDAGLREFTTLVDFELPRDEMLRTVRAARERLAPLLECVNGTTAPVMHAFGHAHLDVAWLWPLAETERKIARTLANQLDLIDEYPGYRFMQSQPHLYRMAKLRYPRLYERVKGAVEAGRIVADGAMWVEADTNITGGESLIRQFVHGKRFFKEELGVESRVMWLPDVFGYSGAMPQIMRGCGVDCFTSQKIFWTYAGGEPFPYNTFIWEGIDGSEVLTHLFTDYNSHLDPASVVGRWRELVQKDGINSRILAFGHGDGGGGPTRDHLEYLRREADLEGMPRVRVSSPREFFAELERDIESRDRGLPRYVGELYYQAHRGTYTSQAKTKRGNRKSEVALREAEMWAAAAGALAGYAFPAAEMDEAWKKVLLNQFHDVLPGSSIARVYDEAEAAYEEVIATAEKVAADARAALVNEAETLTVFNSLGWDRRALVELPRGFEGAVDASGDSVPVQAVDGRAFAEVMVPSCGWATIAPGAPAVVGGSCTASGTLLENDLLRVELGDLGEITSILDRETGRELAAGPCNSFRMYRDVPTDFDAWDIDSMYAETPLELAAEARVEVVAEGPLFARLRIARRLNESDMTQEVTLRRGSRRVEFHTVIDWRESHKLLKVNFPVNVHANEAIHEIQFGHIRRPTHRSRPFDADRFEVCNQKWTALAEEGRGFAVLNDCKYGVNVLANSINLTLLKSPLAPDMNADKGRQEFTYAFFAWSGAMADCGLVREGYELNVPAATAEGEADERSLFAVDGLEVVIETVKPAEDGSGDVIVRLYESMRTSTRTELRTSLPVESVAETNMLEEPELELGMADGRVASGSSEKATRHGRIELDFRPFEIKTLRMRMSSHPC